MPNALAKLFGPIAGLKEVSDQIELGNKIQEHAPELVKSLLETYAPHLAGAAAVLAAVHGAVVLIPFTLVAASLMTKAKEGREKREIKEKLDQIFEALQQQLPLLDRLGDDSHREQAAAKWLGDQLRVVNCPEYLRKSPEAMLGLLVEQKSDEIRGELAELRTAVLTALHRSADLPGPIADAVREAVQQATKAMTDSMAESIGRVLDQRDSSPDFFLPIENADPSVVEGLRYNERYVRTLVGRQAVWGELVSFLEAADPFLWWLLYGDGGQGKSRLALELCLYAVANGWNAGFVRGELPKSIGSWKPDQPTVLVVDYAASRAKSLGLSIARLTGFSHAKPVRILALERQYSSVLDWVKELNTEITCDGSRFERSLFNKDAKLIGSIDRTGFYEMVELACMRAGYKGLNDEHRAIVEAHCDSEVYKRRGLRPLYAQLLGALAAGRLSSGQTLRAALDLRPSDLAEYMLDREQEYWRKDCKASQDDLNAVFYATLADGLTAKSFVDLKSDCPNWVGKASEATATSVSFHTKPENDKWAIPPMLPDLIGEALISLRLQGDLYPDGSVKASIQLASQELLDYGLSSPERLADCQEMLARLAEDFIDQTVVRDALMDRADRLPSAVLERLGIVSGSESAPEADRAAAAQIVAAGSDESEALRLQAIGFVVAGDRALSEYRRQDAIELYNRAVKVFERIRKISGDTPQALRDVSISLDRVADVERSLGQTESALSRYRQSLELSERILEISGDTPQALRDVLVSHVKLSQCDPGEQLSHLKAALALAEQIVQLVPSNPNAYSELESLKQIVAEAKQT